MPYARNVAGLPCLEENEHIVSVPTRHEALFPIFADEAIQSGVLSREEVLVLAVPLKRDALANKYNAREERRTVCP